MNLKSVLLVVLACVCTWLCLRYGIIAEFPLTLIATAVVFPIVFSIGGAYKRRESALDEYGALKAHGRALFYAARDWLEESDPATCDRFKHVIGGLFVECRSLFVAQPEQQEALEDKVYRQFSEISLFIKRLRELGLASGECSRCNQYLSKMMISFENMKHIYQYRTPITLRAYSDVFIWLVPVLYGPYFAAIATDYSPGLEYVTPILFSMILVGLDNIQQHLENPFDQIGEDDVVINAEKFVARLEPETATPFTATRAAGAD